MKSLLISFPDPVEIQLPQEGQGNQIQVNNVSEEYLKLSRHPAYKDSTIVQNAATASRLIVTGVGYVTNAIDSGASSFTQKTKPNPKPITFGPTTQERVRKLNSLTKGAVGLSAATVGQVGRVAQNIGASLTRRGEPKQKGAKGYDKDGRPMEDYKPGLLNKSMIAFSTVADGIEYGTRQILQSGSSAASTVVAHKYGPDAGQLAANLAGGVKNVGLVYVDAAGVSRKAVIKSVAKGMVVGKISGGGQLVVGGGDGGEVPPEMARRQQQQQQDGKGGYAIQDRPVNEKSGYEHGEEGYGNAPPPSYSGGSEAETQP